MANQAAIVAGINGAVGKALAERLSKRFTVFGIARRPVEAAPYRVFETRYDDQGLAEMRRKIDSSGQEVKLVISCIGVLHDAVTRPEKRLSDLDRERLAHSFEVNTIVPALLLKHLAGALTQTSRGVFACLSAKLASIGDNRLGGWYGYRASKVALNMVVKTAAIELTRTHPEASVIAIHPGTTRSRLSEPFTRTTPADKLYEPGLTAERIERILDTVTPEQSGSFFDWSGEQLPW